MPPERLTMRHCEEPNCTKFGDETVNGKCFGKEIVSDDKYNYRDLLEILRDRRNLLNRQMDMIADRVCPTDISESNPHPISQH